LINESKAEFSNAGPRVDIQAPGQNIMSSFNSTGSFGGTTDSRNSSFFIGKISGTSMASPQICGVLATALELYPNMTPTQARDYIRHYSKVGQMTDTGGDVTDFTSLQGADNRYLFYYKERPDSGALSPKNDFFIRPATNRVYPRVKVRR
jgi:subtilisin family serine protease